MQNSKTIAVASALIGGMATFIVSTWQPQVSERHHAREVPGRFPNVAARPIEQVAAEGRGSRRRIELASHNVASRSLSLGPALLGLAAEAAAPAPGTPAGKPELRDFFTEKSDTEAAKVKQDNPKTNKSVLFVKVEFPEADKKVPAGVLRVRIGKNGSVRELPLPVAANSDKSQMLSADVSSLEMAKVEEVTAVWDPDGEGPNELTSSPSSALKLWVDNVPPRVLSVRTTGELGGVAILEIQFANGDLKSETVSSSAKGSFTIKRTNGLHTFETGFDEFTVLDRVPDSPVVRLSLGSLRTDLYQLTLTSEVAAGGVVKGIADQHENTLAEPRKFTFNSLPQATTGTHVEFPEFVSRKERKPNEVFNPGDKVETRVARLYYTRDAHRVAQIINRGVKSHNQSGVDRAKLTAKSARETAEQMVRDRQLKEREAIQAADATRQLERDLAGARLQLEQTRAVMSQRDRGTGQTKENETTPSPKLKSDDQLLADVRAAATKVAELERAVADKRRVENDKREQVEQFQEREDRAKESQFRAEVAAGTEDPDTYVPGDVKSEDPVTQVSVSVIGEGVLQLRGPIRGINKIRTMINQIDTPQGQVKIGIFTVQVNGEHGDRMEKVATRIEGHIDLSRFLTNQSLGYLRRAIQEVAGAVVAGVDSQFPDQHRQIDRDRKYLYAFFGRDFIDELFEMDSEFLHTENKLLSLHGMDTISQSQACFILALSKNDIRQQILDRFRHLVECDLPQAEWDYRKTSSLLPCKLNSQKEVCRNAFEKYKFRNVHGFFDAWVPGSDVMTPMQREFIRLAQIFKSQMVAELELKQRVIERGLIEDSANDELEKADALTSVRQSALQRLKNDFQALVAAGDRGKKIREELESLQGKINQGTAEAIELTKLLSRLEVASSRGPRVVQQAFDRLPKFDEKRVPFDNGKNELDQDLEGLRYAVFVTVEKSELLHPLTKQQIRQAWDLFEKSKDFSKSAVTKTYGVKTTIAKSIQEDIEFAAYQGKLIDNLVAGVMDPRTPRAKVEQTWRSLTKDWEEYNGLFPTYLERLRPPSKELYDIYAEPERQIALSEHIVRRVRRDVDHRKLLEFLIDEQEEKYIELVEGTRSHIAQIDNYLKRLAIALEDDFKVQFYDPAFAGVRAASREWDVNLGQVERTTILTNNRQFAKVQPQATMEFDLPKRAPMIVEGMNGARALVQEYGTLLQDPTFLSLSGMMSGSPVTTGVPSGTPTPGLPNQGLRTAAVRDVLPGQSTDGAEQLMSQTGGPDRKFGAALEGLIPDPAVYKFETGTGFEIRPVIQPDGHSVIYDFDYMYTTNVREPIRPDEKHLGRVKRHFIHTQVQTSSFELREISRYQVALKASRTSRGVPLLEDLPGAGVLFRPLPSDESALQQNIILAQSTVYPTLFDLMGLRWSKYVVDLDHVGLRDLEHVTRGREQSIHDFTFDEASKRVDEFLDIRDKQADHYRPDLYHQQRQPSPNHPGGYQYRTKDGGPEDPRSRGFTVPDRRPEEYRVPNYDSLRRNEIDRDLQQVPTPSGQPESIDLRLMPPEPVPLQGTSTQPTQPSTSSGSARKTSRLQRPTANDDVIQPASFQQPAVAVRREVAPGNERTTNTRESPKPTTSVKAPSRIISFKPAVAKPQAIAPR